MLSRLDDCNALLAGYSDKALNKLQLVLNTADRMLSRTPQKQHITPALAHQNWLPVEVVLLLTYKALHGLLPISLTWSCRTYLHLRYGHKTQASLLSLEFLSKQLKAGLSAKFTTTLLYHQYKVTTTLLQHCYYSIATQCYYNVTTLQHYSNTTLQSYYNVTTSYYSDVTHLRP